MKSKNLLIAGGALVLGGMLMAYSKTQRLIQIFENMTIKPSGLPKKVKIDLQNISFDIDIVLQNPTGEDFAVSGGVATLRKLAVYYKGQFLAVANTNVQSVSVPSYDKMILHDITVVVPTTQLLSVIGSQSLSNVSVNDITVVGTIEAFGTYITV